MVHNLVKLGMRAQICERPSYKRTRDCGILILGKAQSDWWQTDWRLGSQISRSLGETTYKYVAHSHSIVAGGLLLTSYTTRFTPRTLLMIRVETWASRSYGSRDQSAVMKSSVCTARMAMTFSYVRPSPMTPTDCTGSSTANACDVCRYQPAAFSSSSRMAAAWRSTSRRGRVTGPRTRTARPGPGNGWR